LLNGHPPPYDEAVGTSEGPLDESTDSPVTAFLAQPAYYASEDLVPDSPLPSHHDEVVGSFWQRVWLRLTRFMFEKEPSQYSSIAPRTADGRRTKIFFFNGSGRGR